MGRTVNFMARPTLAGLFVCAVMSPTPARATPDCAELWHQRNSLYKAGGYCFRTARAIRAFGNGGCAYDDVADVPLSARQRAAVADIARLERDLGCPR